MNREKKLIKSFKINLSNLKRIISGDESVNANQTYVKYFELYDKVKNLVRIRKFEIIKYSAELNQTKVTSERLNEIRKKLENDIVKKLIEQDEKTKTKVGDMTSMEMEQIQKFIDQGEILLRSYDAVGRRKRKIRRKNSKEMKQNEKLELEILNLEDKLYYDMDEDNSVLMG